MEFSYQKTVIAQIFGFNCDKKLYSFFGIVSSNFRNLGKFISFLLDESNMLFRVQNKAR